MTPTRFYNATTPSPKSANQVVATPWEFIHAVELHRGPLYCDLAATDQNHKAALWITPDRDSLSLMVDWPAPPPGQWNWLNPEFKDISPWVAKCVEQRVRALVLVPASVGSRWYADYVEDKSGVAFLSPRIAFTDAPYPKDLMLLTYDYEALTRGLLDTRPRQWRWKARQAERTGNAPAC